MFVPSDPVLDAALAAADAAGLPRHQISPVQGKLLHLLARVQGARSILEIGTLAGYSTIWLGRALPPDGRLVTLEADPGHADVARANISRAGLSELVDVRVGDARVTLPGLVVDASGPFDLIFIDADKPGNPDYLVSALQVSRPGTLIVADNVIRDGHVIESDGRDADVEGVRRFNDLLASELRVTAIEIQTVGRKGHDGFALALVTS